MECIKKINGIIIAAKAVGDFEGYAVLAIKSIHDLYTKILQIKSLPDVSTIQLSIGIPGFQYFPPKRLLLVVSKIFVLCPSRSERLRKDVNEGTYV